MANSFSQLWQKEVPELGLSAQMYEHETTKAQVLFLLNQDEERVFSIGFRTIPEDSTGVAHILEHSVLGGSKKYPVKEPFVHLLKSSVNSYVNAYTSTEHTVYPVASANKTDFYNLMDVYLDAVFNPLLTERTFKQEGWRYDISDEEPDLKYKGVVFNEMKGSIASPEWSNWQGITAGLFPTNTYKFDSGGNPESIPDLTYEHFVEFHRHFYHPSNSRAYFYGNVDVEDALSKLEEYLQGYSYLEVDDSIAKVAAFAEPKKVETTYGVSEAEEEKPAAYSQVGWAIDASDPKRSMLWEILDEILTGSDASPLRKALTESGLGEGLSGWGFVEGLNQDLYFKGLKGVANANVQKVQQLILSTLEEMAQGIDPQIVEAAINSFEFSLREITEDGVTGITLMYWVIDSWYQKRDPLNMLQFADLLEEVREDYRKNPNLFSELIKTDLLQNNHRVDFAMLPDAEFNAKLEKCEAARLEKEQQAMTREQLDNIKQESLEMQKWQDAPDSEADIAKIPRLQVADLDKQVQTIPCEISESEDTQLYYHDVESRGITYLDWVFDTKWITWEELPYYSILLGLLTRLSTDNRSYEQLSVDIDKNTGGIWLESEYGKVLDSPDEYGITAIRGKVFSRSQSELVRLMQEVLFETSFSDSTRIKQLLQQRKAGIENAIVSNGHNWALRAANSRIDKYEAINDRMYGVEFYGFLSDLISNFESREQELSNKLADLLTKLTQSKVMVNYTGSKSAWQEFRNSWSAVLERFDQSLLAKYIDYLPKSLANVGFTVPAKVNYVALSSLFASDYKLHGSVKVIENILRLDYLWNNVRAKGGAYGVTIRYDMFTNNIGFASYRDPNIEKTLDAYRQAGKYLMDNKFTKGDIEGAIIGVIGSLDQPMTPIEKGWISFMRNQYGFTDQKRQLQRDQVLGTNLDDLRSFGAMLSESAARGTVAVLGSKQRLEEYNKMGGDLEVHSLI